VPTASERERLAAAALRLAQDEDQQQRHDDERDELEDVPDQRGGLRIDHRDVHVVGAQGRVQVPVVRRGGGELLVVDRLTRDLAARDRDLFDLVLLHPVVEGRVREGCVVRRAEHQLIHDEDHQDEDAEDDEDAFEVLAHALRDPFTDLSLERFSVYDTSRGDSVARYHAGRTSGRSFAR
jgi:hypothetical protein